MKSILSKKDKGDAAELAIAAKLQNLGFNISFPFSENARYDIVAEKAGKFYRIQVKYSTPKNGSLRMNGYSSNNWSVKPYSEKEIDVMAVFNPTSSKTYFVPIKKMKPSGMVLRIEKSKNNQEKFTNLASDFEEFPF